MIDILNLEWTSYSSRDRESSTLIANYLRYCGKSVMEGPVHNGYYLIESHKPKIVYISNLIGAKINFEVGKWCKRKNIPLITGLSEAIVEENANANIIFGKNCCEVLIEDILLVWSNYHKKIILDAKPSCADKTVVSGCPGFDRYIIVPKSKWLPSSQQYDMVVGVGCFLFGVFSNRSIHYERISKRYSKLEIARFLSDRDKFDAYLCKIIKAFPNVLFILKVHPGCELGLWDSAIEKCQNESNVRIYKNDRSIFECLSISDIWISYESTTALEAWLLGLPTGLLNPSGLDFPNRQNLWKGQPNFATADEWIEAIRYFQKNGELPGFAEKKLERDKIIEDTIQWADGLNHVRAGNEIIKFLEKGTPSEPLPEGVTTKTNIQALKHTLRYYVKGSPTKWSQKEVERFAQKRMEQQVAFYDKINVDLRSISAL